MITRSFTGLLVLMLVFSAISFSQTSKRGSKKRSDLNLDLDKPFTTPCGVSYKNFDEVMDEADVEWRVAASSSDEVFSTILESNSAIEIPVSSKSGSRGKQLIQIEPPQ